MFTMTVAKRLYFLVVIMAVFMIGIGVLGLRTARHSDDALDTVYQDRVVPLKQLKVVADMYAVNIVDTSHKVRNGNLTWPKGIENVEQAVVTIKNEWSAYLGTVLVAEEQRLIAMLTPRMKKADEAVSRLIGIMRRQDAAALERFTIEELYPVIDPVSETVSQLVDVQLEVAKAVYDRSSEEYHVARLLTIIALLAGVLLSGTLAVFLIRSLDRQLGAEPSEIAAMADKLATGDLSFSFETKKGADTGAYDAMKKMVRKLQAVVSDVRGAAENVSSGSQQLSSGRQQMSQGATEQAAAAEEVSSSMEQMVSNIQQNADNAQQTEKIAQKAAEDARESGKAVMQTVAAMKEIAEQDHRSSRRSRGRRTCWRSTRRSRRRGPASTARGSRWWHRRCASWRSAARRRPGRSASSREPASRSPSRRGDAGEAGAGHPEDRGAGAGDQRVSARSRTRAPTRSTRRSSSSTRWCSRTPAQPRRCPRRPRSSSQAEQLQRTIEFFKVDGADREALQRKEKDGPMSRTILPAGLPKAAGKPHLPALQPPGVHATMDGNGHDGGNGRDMEFQRF